MGKVVVVDVFTFECINCKHVVHELRRLRAALPQRDLVIVGIHSPETPYERVRANVVQNLAAQRITWPVAVDNSFDLWRAYGVEYWPTQLIFDRHGRLRKTVIGEGQDELVAATVRQLVAER
jgi:thiol-disulfide isomerase/thioredoxin